MKALSPAYTPPNRKKIAGVLLDNVHENLSSGKLPPGSTLLMDGWKNDSNNTKHVVAMLKAGEDYKFVGSWDITAIRKTAQELLRICEEAKKKCVEKFKSEPQSVVTGSAANMLCFARQPGLYHSRCASHSAELLSKDIISEVSDHLQFSVQLIQKKFVHPDLEKLLLKEGGKRVILPAATRWCSHRNSMSYFLENLSHMKKIIAEAGESDLSCLKDIGIWQNCSMIGPL